jgi:hypothetical protein
VRLLRNTYITDVFDSNTELVLNELEVIFDISRPSTTLTRTAVFAWMQVTFYVRCHKNEKRQSQFSSMIHCTGTERPAQGHVKI